MPIRLLVTFRAGPTWTAGDVREQPGWDAHGAFIDRLVDDGTVVMGGPFADRSGSIVLLEGLDVPAAARALAADPFLANGVFVLESIRPFEVFVDALPGRDGRPAP